MKVSVKFILGFIALLSLSFITSAAGLHFSGVGTDGTLNSDSTVNLADTINIQTNFDTTLYVLETDQTSLEYSNGQRLYLSGTGKFMQSGQYGDFTHAGGLELYRSSSVNSNCSGESVSYYFTGVTLLSSPYWGDVNIVSAGSYYCPASQKFGFNISGNTLGTIYARNATGSTAELFVFNTAKVMISGAVNVKEEVSLNTAPTVNPLSAVQSEYTSMSTDNSVNTVTNNFVQVKSNFVGSMLDINTTINKNLLSMTKGLTGLQTTSLVPNFNNTFYYYDYRGTQNATASHVNNRGKILTLGTVGLTTNKISVTGENTLIVQGGNLYITNDIYNTDDKNSTLTIVVKRDENNLKNGGNVYIHPNVTNIDAIIIADGSILNYNGTVRFPSPDKDILRRQLLIYGAINTKNTLGDSGVYMVGMDDNVTNKYNLGNLRTFQPIWNDPVVGVCAKSAGVSKLTAMNTDNLSALRYAFAGKKSCFKDDASNYSLRDTEKLSSVVIEYNPILQTNPPNILKNTY